MLGLELSSNDNACLKRGRIVTSQDSGGSWAAPPSLLSGALKGERRGKSVGLVGRAPSRGSCAEHDRWLQSSLGDGFLGRLFQQSGFCTARFVVWFCLLQMVANRLVTDGGDGGGGGDAVGADETGVQGSGGSGVSAGVAEGGGGGDGDGGLAVADDLLADDGGGLVDGDV